MDDADRAGARDQFPHPHVDIPDATLRPGGDLKSALRKARIESAERSDVISELRGAEVARLEILQDQLAPVLAQVPRIAISSMSRSFLPSTRACSSI